MPSFRALNQIAGPVILANLATPLLGFVDVAVIGQLGEAHLLGGLALATMVFSFLFWGFGFLRMGTTALVANAVGAENVASARQILVRVLSLAAVIGTLMWLIQRPLSHVIWQLTDGSALVETTAETYFAIRIWGAPLNLLFIGISGFLLGMGRARAVLALQLLLNFANIVLDVLFVLVWHRGVSGVAEATVWAEGLGVFFGLYLVRRELLDLTFIEAHRALINADAWRELLRVNRDIMLRTLCLIFAFAWFTNQGAIFGDQILAANLVLMQFIAFAAFFIDGYANAAEVIIGRARGALDPSRVRAVVATSLRAGWVTGLIMSLLYLPSIPALLPLIAKDTLVVQQASEFVLWAAITPLLSSSAYLLDGLFIGALASKAMRNAMIQSLALFLLSWWVLQPLANHGLWAAMTLFYLARALTLWRARSALFL